MDIEVDDDGFRYFEHDDLFFHQVGILQFWWRGYVADLTTWTDPPTLNMKLLEWLDINGSKYVDSAFGPPMIQFPNRDVMELFKQEWHIPGEIQSEAYKKWCHRERNLDDETSHDEMSEAMLDAVRVADQHRPEYLKLAS